MKYFIILIIYLLFALSTVESLVHYTKYPAGANGCNIEGGEVEVGGMKDNPNVCGVYVCQNKQGDTLIHYCQRPATFAECPKGCTGVSTVIPFPQCCWICVEYVNCDSNANSTGAPGAGPEGGKTTTTDSGTSGTTGGTTGTTGGTPGTTGGTPGTADTTESTESTVSTESTESTVSTDTSPGEDAETTSEAPDETSTEAPQEK